MASRTNLESSEVDDAVNVWVRRKNLVERSGIGDVDLGELRSLAGDQFNAINDLWGRVVQVVRDDNFVARFQQRKGRERANIARSSVGAISGVALDGTD
jgi:hypothetical protein